MNILVADDDALIRRLLLALLTKLGHTVQVAEDGHAAWKALDVDNPPSLAILDWVMPGMDGVEVCRKLRAGNRKARPYVLLLSAKSDKQEIIAGLDAGADDYLVKPFDPMALMARLRVAQRIITFQQELQDNINSLETLLQRHNLLGEMFGRQGRPGDGPGPGARTLAKGNTEKLTPRIIADERLAEILTLSFGAVGLGSVKIEAAPLPDDLGVGTFTAWAPLAFVKQGVWMDLLFEADDASAVAMFESLLGRIPVLERELLDFLAETFNLICTSVKSSLGEADIAALAPIISRSIRTSSMTVKPRHSATITHQKVTLIGAQANLTIVRQTSPVLRKSLGQLHPFDILAENLPSPSATEVFLLNQGVTLSERYIDKLSSLAKAAQVDLRVPVIQPSRIAEFFCLGRVAA